MCHSGGTSLVSVVDAPLCVAFFCSAVLIPRKRKGGADGVKEMVSMGYGFVEFESKEATMEAIKKYGYHVLSGVADVADAHVLCCACVCQAARRCTG